ncbi:MAG: type II toxin-antitoxin system VapC family toxin [Myxococcota bacterium]|jgi:predicted nucleic acid-binding protein
MNIVDSCGWIEYLSNGSRAEAYAKPLEDTQNLIVPTVCLFEVFKKVLVERGEDAAMQAASLMQNGSVIGLDTSIALEAARLGREHKLPFADSIILATAELHDAVVWTQDAHFRGLGRVNFIE